MNQSFIKISRDILLWEWFQDSNMVHLWTYLLLAANFQKSKFQGVDVERGQLVTGLNSIHKHTGISHQSIRTCLMRLKDTGEITIQSTNRFSIVTICKYDTYQAHAKPSNKPTNKQVTSNQQTTNKQVTTSEEFKNIKEEEELKIYTFSEFWNKYDKKSGKNSCEAKWEKISNEDKLSIKEKLPAYIAATPDIQYRKNPLTYLNQKIWEDEHLPVAKSTKELTGYEQYLKTQE